MSRLRSLAGAVAWLVIIVVIALGGAGVVAGMDHPPGSDARADLTAAGDAEVTPQLDKAAADLAALADQVQALGTQARGALAALNGAEPATSDAAIAQGDLLVADVAARTTALRRELAGVPYVGTAEAGLHISDAITTRHDALVSALDATDGLDFAWARLTIGSAAATKMSELLAGHDRLMGQAADQGVHAKYAAAIKLIDQAAGQLVIAGTIRNQLVATVDVSVLDEWISRNKAYDTALRKLYVEISKVGPRVTAATRAAVKAEAAARARLPPDTRGLVIIMAEIGKGGMNSAIIAIEEARAELSDAIDAQAPASSDQPGATDQPAATNPPAVTDHPAPTDSP